MYACTHWQCFLIIMSIIFKIKKIIYLAIIDYYNINFLRFDMSSVIVWWYTQWLLFILSVIKIIESNFLSMKILEAENLHFQIYEKSNNINYFYINTSISKIKC